MHTPCVVRVPSSLVEVWRQRPTKRIREGREMCLAVRRPRRTRKVIEGASEASRRRERRSEAQQRRRSSGGAAVSLRRAVLVEDDRRGDEQERERERGRASSGCLSTPRLRSSCLCVWPAATWPLGGLPSAVCGCSNAMDGGTTDRARASRLAPCIADPDRGGKPRAALCWVMCFFSLSTGWLGAGKKRPVVHGAGVVWQR